MIKTIGLSKIFRTESVQTTALNEVSLEINQGEFVALWDLPVVVSLPC